jgi:hypothetical protein
MSTGLLGQARSQICRRFNAVAAQLQGHRPSGRTLVISDKYDVQDLLNAMLRLYFDDVHPEEPTPSFGGASRTDFLLKEEQIVVEAKNDAAHAH